MYDPQHRLDLHDEDHPSSPIHRINQSSFSNATTTGASGNVDPYLFNDLVEMIPLVHSYIEQNAKSSFTRRGSMAYTKTPSRESLYKKRVASLHATPNAVWPLPRKQHYKTGEAKVKHAAQSIPLKKRREVKTDADSFSFLPSREVTTEKDREELNALREQVEDLHRKLSEKDELLKSAEVSKDQLSSVHAKLEELKKLNSEKDSVLKSSQLQLSDTKIKLADKQAAFEKLQWEAMTSNKKVEQLEEDLHTIQEEMSSFMLLFEGLSKNDKNTQSAYEHYDITPYHSDIDDLDEKEMEKIEAAQETYIAAVANAKEKQDEESIAKAASARLQLQSFVLRTENAEAMHYFEVPRIA